MEDMCAVRIDNGRGVKLDEQRIAFHLGRLLRTVSVEYSYEHCAAHGTMVILNHRNRREISKRAMLNLLDTSPRLEFEVSLFLSFLLRISSDSDEFISNVFRFSARTGY